MSTPQTCSYPERRPFRMNSGVERAAVLHDQHPLWLDAVEQVLDRIEVDVAGKATSPDEALALVEQHQPDLFVTEVETANGGMDGITCLRLAVERVPTVRPVALSMYADPQRVDAALAAGAVAYVVKTAHPDDLASAVRQAFDHSVYLASARIPRPALVPERPEDETGLTRREVEILKLVSQGHSNAQLAKMLWVTEQTVKFHLSNIYRKLDVANRTEASRWAQVNGLLPTGPALVPVPAA
jgi:DNA-binding NarL/FixJ family response regulator